MKLLFKCAATFLMCFSATSQAQARAMECSYDYVTHLATHYLEEAPDGESVNMGYTHTISPTGGEEMYLWEPNEIQSGWPVELVHVMGMLYRRKEFDDFLRIIDFERAEYVGVSGVRAVLEGGAPAGPQEWSCRRLD